MAQVNNTNNELKRTMKSRHLFMIALGGVIERDYLTVFIIKLDRWIRTCLYGWWIINVFRYALSW